MARRKKELFELLNRERHSGPAPEAAPRAATAAAAHAATGERSASGGGARPAKPERAAPRGARRRGFGGRKVPVSLNVLLLFIGAFVVTNVCSYIVGKGMSGQAEVPLATEMRLFLAVKVTPPVAAQHSFAVWGLRDQLHDAGFEQTEVLGLDHGNYLQVVAGRFSRDRGEDCRRLEHRVRDYLARRAPRPSDSSPFEVPIDVKTITISYIPQTRREPTRAP